MCTINDAMARWVFILSVVFSVGFAPPNIPLTSPTRIRPPPSLLLPFSSFQAPGAFGSTGGPRHHVPSSEAHSMVHMIDAVWGKIERTGGRHKARAFDPLTPEHLVGRCPSPLSVAFRVGVRPSVGTRPWLGEGEGTAGLFRI